MINLFLLSIVCYYINMDKVMLGIVKSGNSKINFIENNNMDKVNVFINTFVVCETITKDIIYNYKLLNNKKVKLDDIKLYCNTIDSAFSFFNLDNSLVKDIFSSKYYSCKKIRDRYMHSFSISTIKYINNNYDVLMALLNKFLDIILVI